MAETSSSWAGYWAGTTYIQAHHADQEPWRIAMAARAVGGAHPDTTAPFVYCDIGCGCGITLLTLAAALPHGRFHGVDLNPDHVAEARRMAEAAGLVNVAFHLGAAETLLPETVPPCDFIAAHGVFSWVTPDVAGGIVRFIREKLKPDGLCFASINLEVGWAQMLPVRRHLVETHAAGQGAPEARLRAAVDSAWAIFGPSSDFAEQNPVAAKKIAGWTGEFLNYIPHEMMNAAWRLFTLREAYGMFRPAGLVNAGAWLRNETDMREKYARLIGGGDDVAVEDDLSKARGEQFRRLILRPEAGAGTTGATILPQTERFGATSPRKAADLFEKELLDSLDAAERALASSAVNGEGVTLAEIVAKAGREAKLKLFASVNQLARRGEIATYRAAPAPSTSPERITPCHPLTPVILSTRRAIAVNAHAPSPVFGGGVRLPGPVAALLRVELEGAAGLAGPAERLYRDAVEDPAIWAATDPAEPRQIPDFADLERSYRRAWRPFLERMRVIRAA